MWLSNKDGAQCPDQTSKDTKRPNPNQTKKTSFVTGSCVSSAIRLGRTATREAATAAPRIDTLCVRPLLRFGCRWSLKVRHCMIFLFLITAITRLVLRYITLSRGFMTGCESLNPEL